MDETADKIERLRGYVAAMEPVLNALLRAVPTSVIEQLEAGFHEEVAVARSTLQSFAMSEQTLEAFEKSAQDWSRKLDEVVQGRS